MGGCQPARPSRSVPTRPRLQSRPGPPQQRRRASPEAGNLGACTSSEQRMVMPKRPKKPSSMRPSAGANHRTMQMQARRYGDTTELSVRTVSWEHPDGRLLTSNRNPVGPRTGQAFRPCRRQHPEDGIHDRPDSAIEHASLVGRNRRLRRARAILPAVRLMPGERRSRSAPWFRSSINWAPRNWSPAITKSRRCWKARGDCCESIAHCVYPRPTAATPCCGPTAPAKS